METAIQGLRLLSIALNAAPIPDPFKSAVTAIPDIVAAVKGNLEDAVALAICIANVTDTNMRPFKTKPAGELEKSLNTKRSLEEFRKVLETIKEDMAHLMSRRLGSKVLSYDSDASKLAVMKQSVDDAINQLQLETVIAVGHGVDIMSHEQNRMFEDQRQMNQDQCNAF
ncbi:hypothetical protein FRB94_007710 [Tulasnella sp. JGI-2019a]|nr:hypothetical protein FRB94_007710 [Tulasnella sp. JGI-2019a]